MAQASNIPLQTPGRVFWNCQAEQLDLPIALFVSQARKWNYPQTTSLVSVHWKNDHLFLLMIVIYGGNEKQQRRHLTMRFIRGWSLVVGVFFNSFFFSFLFVSFRLTPR